MAISKTQNERPAINALIDLANGLEISVNGQAAQISNLQGALASEVSSRTDADALLAEQIQSESSTRANADTSLESAIASIHNILGSDFSESHSVSDFSDSVTTDIENLQTFESMILGSIKFGIGTQATVQGNNYYDGTVTYQTAYPATFVSFVFPAFVSGIEQSDLEVTVSECDHEGFSYTVINRSANSATFTLGYLAIGLSVD